MRVAERKASPTAALRQADLIPLAEDLVVRGEQLELSPDQIVQVVRQIIARRKASS